MFDLTWFVAGKESLFGTATVINSESGWPGTTAKTGTIQLQTLKLWNNRRKYF